MILNVWVNSVDPDDISLLLTEQSYQGLHTAYHSFCIFWKYNCKIYDNYKTLQQFFQVSEFFQCFQLFQGLKWIIMCDFMCSF